MQQDLLHLIYYYFRPYLTGLVVLWRWQQWTMAHHQRHSATYFSSLTFGNRKYVLPVLARSRLSRRAVRYPGTSLQLYNCRGFRPWNQRIKCTSASLFGVPAMLPTPYLFPPVNGSTQEIVGTWRTSSHVSLVKNSQSLVVEQHILLLLASGTFSPKKARP